MASKSHKINHYEVAIEAVKYLEEAMIQLGANKRSKAYQKVKEIATIWNTKMRNISPFPKCTCIFSDIRRILQIRNNISHKKNYTTIPDLYEFTTRMASIKTGLSLMRQSIESGENRFVDAINIEYSFVPDHVIKRSRNSIRELKSKIQKLDKLVAQYSSQPHPMSAHSRRHSFSVQTIATISDVNDANTFMIVRNNPIIDVSPHVPLPIAIENFNECNLSTVLMNNIRQSQFTTPTPFQKAFIPAVRAHRDIMSCVRRGHGKTSAFLVPIIHNLCTTIQTLSERHYHSAGYPSAVIIAPTRDLVMKIHRRARKLLYRTGLRMCAAAATDGDDDGVAWEEQVRNSRNGVDILIATPRRLICLLRNGFVKMSAVRYDVWLELERSSFLTLDNERTRFEQIVDEMPRKGRSCGVGGIGRQSLMVSTTLPLDTQKLMQPFLHNYICITVEEY
eukprot:81762_1